MSKILVEGHRTLIRDTSSSAIVNPKLEKNTHFVPGGPTSNLITQVARGNIGLSRHVF